MVEYEIGIPSDNRGTTFRQVDKDIQGLPWGTQEMPYSRDQLRESRLLRYRPFRNCNDELDFANSTKNTNCKFYCFKANHPEARCGYRHFQLRHCVKTTSRKDLYMVWQDNTIMHYNPFSKKAKKVKQGYSDPRIEIVSFDVMDNLVLSGGLEGELHLDDLSGNSLLREDLADTDSTKITNYCSFFKEGSRISILTCSNDHKVRIIDPENFRGLHVYEFKSCVNHGAFSPDKNLLGVALDAQECYIRDLRCVEDVYELEGHKDYGFGFAWHPGDSNIVATGNQDMSVMIWDLRKGSKLSPLYTLCGNMGGILNVKFSNDGKYLAFSESADFFHVYDTRSFTESQVVDVFGEISGFCFSSEDSNPQNLYLGMADATYSSLLEFSVSEQLIDNILI